MIAADSTTIGIIAIALLTSLIAPIVLNLLQARIRRQERLEDWARQDKVAEKQAEAVQATADVAESARKAAVGVAERVAEVAESQGAKLDEIHTLVNSNLLASMQGELNALRSSLASLEEIQKLKKEAGKQDNATELIESLRKRIGELSAQVEERTRQTQKAAEG